MHDREKIEKKLELFKHHKEKSIPYSEIRINRYLAMCGVGSRREVEKYILEGKVLVNGIPVKDLSYKVKKDDLVLLNGKRVTIKKKHIYLAFNKPIGYVVSKKKFKNEKSVYSLLPEHWLKDFHLSYAGRLDKNSRGLVIFSSDGMFIHHLTHPKYKVLKRYWVQLDESLTLYDLNLLTGKGIQDKGEILRAISITVKDVQNHIYEVVLGEGKKRHIRRMFGNLLYEVKDLYRVAIGKLHLENYPIPEGEYREIDPSWIWEDNPENQYIIQLYKQLSD